MTCLRVFYVSVCVCVCAGVLCVSVCVCAWMCVYYVCLRAYVHECVRILCLSVCMRRRVCVLCVSLCVRVCEYVCLCVCINVCCSLWFVHNYESLLSLWPCSTRGRFNGAERVRMKWSLHYPNCVCSRLNPVCVCVCLCACVPVCAWEKTSIRSASFPSITSDP